MEAYFEGGVMTKKDKVFAIYRNLPKLANDDIGLIIYLMNRHGANLTNDQEKAIRRMGNSEHWTRVARLVRAEHPELVNSKTREAREKEFVDYRYNNAMETAPNTIRDKALSLFNN